MSLLDRAIASVSPKWAFEREQYRRALNTIEKGIPDRLSENWGTAQGFRFGTEGDRRNIASTRDRAYQAYDNNPVATALVDTETDNVIGDGLNYQPMSSSPEWNREAEERYYEWLEDCSVRGPDIHPGCEVQRHLWTQSRVAGDVGWILVGSGGTNGQPIQSRIQVVRAENIVTPDEQYGNPNIYDGIRFDALGRPTEFYVLSYDDKNSQRVFRAIPARDFVYLPHYTGTNQARPPSCFNTIFDLLAHLDRYVDGVSLAAWMATVFGVIFKQENAAKQLSQLSTVTDSGGEVRRAFSVQKSGLVKFMSTKDEVAQVQAHQPMQQTPDFIRAMFRMIGQPFRMPLEVIAMDMSSCNFASARIGLIPFYRSCDIKASRFGSRWSRTIRWWLSREKNRAPDDPNKWATAFPEDYWNHELLPNARDYTDPVSEAQSDHLQMDMGTKSPQMVIAERGRNAAKIIRERLEWAKQTKELPAVNSTMTRHPQSGVGATGDPLGKEAVEPPQPAESKQEEPKVDAVKAYARAYRDIMQELETEEPNE